METSRSHVRSLSKSQVDSLDELIELEKDEVELVKTTGFTIGIVIGALTVILLIVLFIFGYRWHSRRGDITKALYIPKPRPASSLSASHARPSWFALSLRKSNAAAWRKSRFSESAS